MRYVTSAGAYPSLDDLLLAAPGRLSSPGRLSWMR